MTSNFKREKSGKKKAQLKPNLLLNYNFNTKKNFHFLKNEIL